MDWEALRQAARRGLRPGKPLQEPLKLLRLAIGMLAATIIGYVLHNPEQQLLVIVGAFLGTIAAVMPHNRTRVVATAVTCLAQVVAAALGVLLGGNWAVVLPVAFVLLLVSGLLRSVGIGISVRVTVVAIALLAFTEIAPDLTSGGVSTVGYFSLGFAVMLVAQLLPPYASRHSSQRREVAGLYRALAAGESEDAALLAADRSLALLRRRRHRELDRLAQLVARAEEIGQQVAALGNRTDETSARWHAAATRQLSAIADVIDRPRSAGSLGAASWPQEMGNGLELALSQAVDTATRLASGREVPRASDQRRVPGTLELVRDELRWGSPILHHAMRLAVVCLIAQLAGMAVGRLLGPTAYLAGHGFWAVVAAALIVFPDYGSTFSRGIGRTIGTVGGVILGVALSFLPGDPLLHAVLLLVLFYGYLAFRSCGQPCTMFWVVAWIGSLTPGPLGAITRGVDTLIGCLLAFAAYLIAPTWQRRLLTERLAEWARATARQIDALVLLWTADDEQHRLAVARSDTRARSTGLEFVAAAAIAQHEPRDPHGRWDNDTLGPATDAVATIRRQIAALSALAPLWSTDDRTGTCLHAETMSRALDAVAELETVWATADVETSHVSADTAAALDRLREAGATVERIAAAQTTVGAR